MLWWGGPYDKRNLLIRKLTELKYKQRDVTMYKKLPTSGT